MRILNNQIILKVKQLLLIIIIVSTVIACSSNNEETKESSIEAINSLLAANPEDQGFIIFNGKNELDFIQFGLEEYGFMLFWPYIESDNKGLKELDKVKSFLDEDGYIQIKKDTVSREDVVNLNKYEYLIDDDGIYANVGKEDLQIFSLIENLFKKIYGYEEYRGIKIDLEIYG